MNPTVSRILHIIGIAVAVAVPVLTAVLTGLPATSKAAVVVAAVLGILSSLKGAFGTPDATATVTAAGQSTADLLVTAGATPKRGDVVKLDPQTRPGSSYDKGTVSPLTLAIVFGLAVLGVVLTAQICKADESVTPQLGGCFDNGLFCAGTAIQISVTKIGLSPGNKGISGGWNPGVGYGLTVAPDRWYASGLDLFLNVDLSGSTTKASRVSPALMLHLLNYVFAGVSLDVIAPTDTAGSYGAQWSALIGFGSTITSITPGYAKAEARRQLAAERANAGAAK